MNSTTKSVILDDIATIRTGVLLGRYKAGEGEECEFIHDVLGLKAINEDGTINEDDCMRDVCFNTSMDKHIAYDIGEVVMRMSNPFTAAIIDKHAGYRMVIPSQFIRITLNPPYTLLPEYLAIVLNSDIMKTRFQKGAYGTVIVVVRVETLRKMKLAVPPMKIQEQIIELNREMIAEKRYMKALLKQRTKFAKNAIESALKQYVPRD
jgi:hypothetical protein